MGYFKELRKKTLPEDKKEEVKTDIIAYYIIRPLGDIFTYPFLKMKISATTVTKISAIFAILMYIVFLAGSSTLGYLIAILLLFIWDILDAVDGNIARFTDTCSPRGGLWDATVGWVATYFFFSAMGIVAFKENSIFKFEFIPQYIYIICGFLSGMGLIFPRLVMHKKAGLFGSENIKKDKDRKNYGIIKKVIFNITSVNGLAMIFFVISIYTKTSNICTLIYCVLNMAIGIGMTLKLLYK